LSGFGSTIIDARESYRYNSDTELCSRDARAALRDGGAEYGPQAVVASHSGRRSPHPPPVFDA